MLIMSHIFGVLTYTICNLQVTIYHLLKLFQTETDIMLGKKSLVVEFYDELVSIMSLEHVPYNIISSTIGRSYNTGGYPVSVSHYICTSLHM